MNLILVEKFIKQARKKDGQPGTQPSVDKLIIAFNEYFKIQEKEYLENLKTEMEISEKIIKTETGEKTEEANKILQTFLAEITSSMSIKGAELLLENLNISSDFLISDVFALEFAKKRAGEMIANIDETTRKQINGIITKGIEEGADFTQISKLIKTKFVSFSKFRADFIAINEIGHSYEFGKLAQAEDYEKRSGVTMNKKWVNQGDNRVTDGCVNNAQDGWIKIGDDFSTGDERPPRFPGCRCYLQYKSTEALNFDN